MAHAKTLQRPQLEPGAAPGDQTLPPIWKEAFWPVDWLSLRMSPVYYGLGVPLGDGSPVVVVPGFMGTDAYLYELYLWLARIGYRPYMSGIGVNAECPGRLARRLLSTIRRAHDDTGLRVRVVGHSLGGLIGRRACLEQPGLISQLIYLGSPLQAVRAHPAMMATAALLRLAMTTLSVQPPDCLTESCACGFVENVARPLPRTVSHAAIFTRTDGIVDWHDSQEREARRNHEVGGTHIGLVYNSRAYSALAELLAHPS